MERFLLWRSHKLHLWEGTGALYVYLSSSSCSNKYVESDVLTLFHIFFFCSKIVWIVAMSWKGACSEQLMWPWSTDRSTWRVRTGRAKGQFWNEPRGCSSKCLSSVEGMPFSSKVNPVQRYQQVQYSRPIKEGGLLFFKVPIDLYIKNIFMLLFFINTFYKTVFHVQLNIWMCISLCKSVGNLKFYEAKRIDRSAP